MEPQNEMNPNYLSNMTIQSPHSLSQKTNDLMLQVIENQLKADAEGSPRKDTNEDDRSSTDIESTDRSDDDIPNSSRCFLIGLIAMFGFLGIVIGILFAAGVLENDDLKGIPILENIDFEGFFDSDPFGGEVSPENPEDAYRWYNPDQGGLELTILNALTDDWQAEFETAMNDWEVGSPDSLTLTARQVEVDPDCYPLNGLLKVCNGDYGETDWRGLNTILLDLDGKWIYSSTAQMNEFYLRQGDPAQRLYTMCHELGHGFGLPHWDEDFYNRNLGNCMDYTSRPRSNQRPDRSNFEFLKALYGEVGTTLAPTEAATQAPNLGWGPGSNGPPLQRPPPKQKDEKKENKKEEKDRRPLLRRQRQLTSSTRMDDGTIPQHIMDAYRSVVLGHGADLDDNSQFSRILFEEDESTMTLTDLGEGYGLLVYKLKA